MGLKLAPLTDELRTKFNIDAKLKGVIVLEVDPDSAAAQKSVKIGDVIVEAAQDTVSTPDDVSKSIEKVRKPAARPSSCASRTPKATCASWRCR